MNRLISAAAAGLLATLSLAMAPAKAAVPDQVWLTGVSNAIGGSTPSNTLTFSDGSTATQTLTANNGNQCLPGGEQASPVGETNPYYTPSIPPGTAFETMGCTGRNSFATTITFTKPVSNLRMHLVNVDGSSVTLGGVSTTGAPLSAQKDTGNNALTVSANTINPSPVGVGYGGCQANNGSHQYGQCGTVVLSAPSGAIKSFTLSNVSVTGNDGWAVSYSFPAPPTAEDDAALTAADTPVTIVPLDNDDPAAAPFDPTTVRLLDGDTPVTELTTSDGVYAVDTTTGEVTFTPASGFTGTAGPVTYQIADVDGSIATATITVTVAPEVGVSMASPSALGGLVAALGVATGGVMLLRRRRATAV